jgi:hypothetical protein
MIKVHILERCKYCDGQAYVLAGEAVDSEGNTYPRYQPCIYCKGSGELDEWLTLDELANLLNNAACTHSQVDTRGGFHHSGGETWDDIEIVCSDCGEHVEYP